MILSNLLRLEKLDNYLQEWRVPVGSFWRDNRAHAQVVRSDHRLFRVAVTSTIYMDLEVSSADCAEHTS